MLVGIGPGSTEHMTARARAAIAEADTIIGYVTYIKLVADLLDGKEVVRKGMTEELDRAVHALAAARAGKKVALISSGDAGVYGMAGPTYEVLFQAGWTPEDHVAVAFDRFGRLSRSPRLTSRCQAVWHLPAFRRDRALALRTGACRGSLPPFGRLSLARRGRGVPGRVRSGG
mgnify:CR=1 FL=1